MQAGELDLVMPQEVGGQEDCDPSKRQTVPPSLEHRSQGLGIRLLT